MCMYPCVMNPRQIIWEGMDTEIKLMGALTSLLSQFTCNLLPCIDGVRKETNVWKEVRKE